MNPTEAIMLLRKVKAHCPSQMIDEYTPDAWAEALDDIRYTDANEALLNIVKRPLDLSKSRYIEPGHIRGEVNRLRNQRIDRYGNIEIPDGLDRYEDLDELRVYQEYTWRARRAIGDGSLNRGDPTPSLEQLRHVTSDFPTLKALISAGDSRGSVPQWVEE